HPALRDLSPAAPDVGDAAPELRAGRRVPQRGERLSGVVGGALLRRGAGGARFPSVPWAVEPVSIAGLESPALQPLAQRRGARLCLDRDAGEHLLPGGGAERPGGAAMSLDSKIPSGPLAGKWLAHRNHLRLVNPSNK